MGHDFICSPPTDPWLTIVHRDRGLLVVDKQSGLLSTPGRVHPGSALSRVLGEVPRAYDVHRLDMETSGLLVFALRRSSGRELKRQCREREVHKTYKAVVWGRMDQLRGEIDVPLSRVAGPLPRSVVDRDSGRSALTVFEVIDQAEDRTVLRLRPKMGRSHQLRAHLAAVGHPIIGDRFYGTEHR
jgi:tRNA pseudouridine32 synthase/23S rRNA pseudouridine746 synthase